jgi:hypothetical protein
LQTRIAATRSVFVVHAGEKLTASLELNLRAPFFDAASRARNHDKLRLIKLLARSLCQQLVNFFEEASPVRVLIFERMTNIEKRSTNEANRRLEI